MSNILHPISGPLCIFDLEATCWADDDPMRERQRDESEIIEIGAVMLRPDPHTLQFEVAEEFTTFVRPDLHRELSPFCTQLTTITQEDVDNAPSFRQAFTSFSQWMLECWLKADGFPIKLRSGGPSRASWGLYDHRMLDKSCTTYNIADPFHVGPKLNLKELYARQMKRLKRSVPSKGLASVMKALNMQPSGTHHRGVDDARDTAKVMAQLWRKANFSQTLNPTIYELEDMHHQWVAAP